MRISRSVAPHITASLVIIALAGCQVVPETGGRQPSPAPTPAPTAPAPAPVPAPSQSSDAWEVAPVTSGSWGYESRTGESVASFGASPVAPLVVLRCQKSSRQVSMTLAGSPSPRVTLRTSKGVLDWSGATQPMGGASGLVITRPANDPGLDWMAFSRGRVSIEPAGGQRIILPVVSEIGRVVEDCRS